MSWFLTRSTRQYLHEDAEPLDPFCTDLCFYSGVVQSIDTPKDHETYLNDPYMEVGDNRQHLQYSR